MNAHTNKPARTAAALEAAQPASLPLEGAEGQPSVDHQIVVVGLGYIGLPTAAVLAGFGWQVCGVDVTPEVVETVNSGGVHIEERDLDRLVHEAVETGRLRASVDMPRAHFYMIAVPTPLGDDYQPNIEYVEAAARAIAPKLTKGACVIVESTSPIGTTEKVGEIFDLLRPDLDIPKFGDTREADIALAYCPERVLPGKIVEELVSNDRVIGGVTEACATKAATLYRSFVKGECLMTNSRAAEMVKLTENSFRDVNIAFANELSMVADKVEIDVWDIIRLANRHPRVNILQPGPGVGGHCIAVDPWFLVSSAPEQTRLVRTARKINDHKAVHTASRIRTMLEAAPDAKVAMLGLAFKPNIDDFRESPSLEIAEVLASEFGERILCVEPFTDALPGALAERGAKLVSLDAALEQSEIVAVLVDHDAFKSLTLEALQGKMVYDTRGMLKK